MIDLLIMLGAAEESRALSRPDYSYELTAQVTVRADRQDAPAGKPWQMPDLSFDDSQDCRTFLERRLEGFGTLRIGPLCPEGGEQPAPWRSL